MAAVELLSLIIAIAVVAIVVTAGLGTSYVPLRYGAPPDIWMITIRGPDMP